MKMYVCVMRDVVADVFGQPMFVASIGGAVRSFGDECQRKEQGNMLAAHPGDFELFHIGEYDDSTGVVTMLPFKSIALGSSYVS
jgi:hypothetical protein